MALNHRPRCYSRPVFLCPDHYATLGWASTVDRQWKKRASGKNLREMEHGGAPLPDAVAMGLPAEARGLWEDGALTEEEEDEEGGFMEEGLLTVVAVLMTGGHSAHAVGCL